MLKINMLYISSVLLLGLSSKALSDTNVKVAPVKKTWSGYYENYIDGPRFDASSETFVNHYLGVRKKFSEGWSLTAVARLDSDLSKEAKKPHSSGDHYLKLQYPTIFKNNLITVSGQVRTYIGSSPTSKEAGKIAHIQPRLYVSSKIDRFSFQYVLIPYIYLYDSNSPDHVAEKHVHIFSAEYSFNKEWSASLEADPGWTRTRSSKPVYNKSPIYLGLSKSFSKQNISVTGYMASSASKVSNETSNLAASISYSFL